MKVNISIKDKSYSVDLKKGMDISIPLVSGSKQVNCFWAPLFEISPVKTEHFVGSIEEGGLVNFKNVRINPHGNGTHTECIGHISKEVFNINQVLKEFHHIAELITIIPQKLENGDRVITESTLKPILDELGDYKALIVRTSPNSFDKKQQIYSGTNPCYINKEAMDLIVKKGIEHLLIDLPSLDREEDGGILAAHNTFWNYFGSIDEARTNCTVTELIYVPDTIKDGTYLLNLQIASFEMDASPSKPVLYPLEA